MDKLHDVLTDSNNANIEIIIIAMIIEIRLKMILLKIKYGTRYLKTMK